MDQLALILLVFVLPTVSLLVAFFYLRFRASNPYYAELLQLNLFSSRLLLTRSSALQVALLLVLFLSLEQFLPVSYALLVPLLGALLLLRVKPVTATAVDGDTLALLRRLSSMQTEIAAAVAHVQRLSQTVDQTQAHLTVKEREKAALDITIQARAKEARLWSDMTQEQKQAFTAATAAVVAKSTRGQFFWGLLLGFVLNLLASTTWALMGNPGKQEIIANLEEVFGNAPATATPPVSGTTSGAATAPAKAASSAQTK